MKYSFVMPVYNREKLVGQAMLSLVNQDFPKNDFEIIVIDDNSSDGSSCIIKNLIEKYSSQLNIKYYKNLENLDVGITRDLGVRKTTGDIVIQTEDDAFYPPDYLATIDREIKNLEKVGMCWGALIVLPRKSLNFSDGILPKLVQFRRDAITELTRLNKRPVIGGWIYRKNIYEMAGGYQNLSIGEDTALVKRIKDLGYQNLAIFNTFWSHSEPNNFWQFFKRQYKQGCHYWNYKKNLNLASTLRQKLFWLGNFISFFVGFIFIIYFLILRNIFAVSLFLFFWFFYIVFLILVNQELRLLLKNIFLSKYKFIIIFLPFYYFVELCGNLFGRLIGFLKICL